MIQLILKSTKESNDLIISSLRNNGSGHQLHYFLQSFPSLTDSKYLQNQGSRLDTIIETETKEQLKPPFIKRILVVDDDPDITLTFKAGLDRHYYGDAD